MSDDHTDEIISMVTSDRHVFLTGSGGTGKSYTLRHVYDNLSLRGMKVWKTGSTGVAAESIGGITLHSWGGIGLADKSPKYYVDTMTAKVMNRWLTTEILIIDEISMIGAKVFTLADQVGRLIRRKDKPFGGIILIICGDMCQLQPVKDEYIFTSELYHTMDFYVIRLSKPWRYQKDLDFFALLSRARLGDLTPDDHELLYSRRKAYETEIKNKTFSDLEIKPTKLYSRRIDVLEMNMAELHKIDEEEFKYSCTDNILRKVKTSRGIITGYQEIMNKNVSPDVHLKKGAQVMLTANLDVSRGLCNGSRGVILECTDAFVTVKFKSCELNVTPHSWTIEDEENIFTRTQFPLILAWCITIHRSQSATLDSVIVDLGTSIFSANMGYVALSRCRELSGIYLINFIPEKIKCDPVAKEFELQMMIEEGYTE